ncbi:MAG: YicC family protein [Lentisphaerae bacterium]|nr:YicC family protein [Lentisphaerota bacterium]
MSLSSMTGFGHGECRVDGLRVEVEVSSVNKKQLDLQLHLPRAMQALESRIQDEVGRAVARGRVTVNVQVAAVGGAAHRVRVNRPLAKAYVDAIRSAAKDLGLPDTLDSRTLAELPDLLVVEHPEEDTARLWPVLLKALRQALARLVRMRRAEGRVLATDVLRRVDALERRLAVIERHAPEASRRYREALMKRLAEAGLAAAGHEDRIAREVAFIAERGDICEELTRLQSHFAQARRLVHGAGPSGRSLDFLAQEMFREINTVGSKASDAAIGVEVVEFKAELERVREQVQNVE